jgi:hypothetical protein
VALQATQATCFLESWPFYPAEQDVALCADGHLTRPNFLEASTKGRSIVACSRRLLRQSRSCGRTLSRSSVTCG